ncbi:MAG: hypothetical protein WD823_03585, partial [Sulfuricaulis sp.]|uniref:hypothetical protein n=1 Tax=Sulfuricaulis sp. TaxID=2003553 RepID=UPI0034A3ABAE
PGIGISPIADMDAHQTIVTAAAPTKSSAETPKKAPSEIGSEARAETGRFLFVRKSLRVNLQTGKVTVLSTKPNN